PEAGLEPARPCGREILSLLRIPFRHSGREIEGADYIQTPRLRQVAGNPCTSATCAGSPPSLPARKPCAKSQHRSMRSFMQADADQFSEGALVKSVARNCPISGF